VLLILGLQLKGSVEEQPFKVYICRVWVSSTDYTCDACIFLRILLLWTIAVSCPIQFNCLYLIFVAFIEKGHYNALYIF
jgi:hypothetical protein